MSMVPLARSDALSGPDISGAGSRKAYSVALCVAAALFAVPTSGAAESGPRLPMPATTDELFSLTNVWTVHFRFTPEQWEAMEPDNEGPGFFGPPPGGPPTGGEGRPEGRIQSFGPGMMFAPIMLRQGDKDGDGKLSRPEFTDLGERWFSEWDKARSGKLKNDQIRDGINGLFPTPNFGPPRGGPGERPGGGPRRMGLNLQGPEGKRNGLASAMGIEFEYVHADLEFNGKAFKNVAVRYKGNGTWMQSRGSLKRSFKVDLNEFVKGQKLVGISKLNFHNCVTDASWMNEVLSHRLFRDAGAPAPRTAYARVYVTVPGKHDREYFGLYSLVENVDNNFAFERFGTRKGAIFKPVTPELFEDLGDDWSKYNQTYDPKTDVTPEQTGRVIEFSRLVTRADDAEFAAKVGDYLDLEAFGRFMAVTVALSTMDSILAVGQNYYMYLHPATGKFQFIPWDLDHSFGQFPLLGNQDQREQLSIHRPWQGENRFLERVYKLEGFKTAYMAALKDLSERLFLPERIKSQVDEIAAAIRPAVADESDDKLDRFDRVVAGEPVPLAGFGGGPPARQRGGGPGAQGGGFPSFFQPPKPIKGFVEGRAQSLADQLAGRSEGEVLAGFGFGPRGGRGGRGGPPEGFGPGMFLGPLWMASLDTGKDEEVSREEFIQGFAKWFDAWDSAGSGHVTEEQIREGLNAELSPFGGNPPPGGGFGPPPGGLGRERND